jgi:hypothetical protein
MLIMQGAHNRQPHGNVSVKSEASQNMSTCRNQSNRIGYAEAELKRLYVLLDDSTIRPRSMVDLFKVIADR